MAIQKSLYVLYVRIVKGIGATPTSPMKNPLCCQINPYWKIYRDGIQDLFLCKDCYKKWCKKGYPHYALSEPYEVDKIEVRTDEEVG